MSKARTTVAAMIDRYRLWRSKRVGADTAAQATAYWASQTDFISSYATDPMGISRSQWLADEIVPTLGIDSLLEVGTNSGRNLDFIHRRHPRVRLRGIDVNPRALDYARQHHPEIDFQLNDANAWSESPDSWDAILTMSLLDHVPDEAVDVLAAQMASTARKWLICIELWDGGHGTRGPYKYSRDTRLLFERHGARTARWELAPGQYDELRSPLWVYIGSTAPP